MGGTYQIASAMCGFLPTAREGNVFRGVCQSFCSQRISFPPSPDTDPLQTQTPLWTATLPDSDPPELTSSGSHCSGRNASHWNALLLYNCNCLYYLHSQPTCHTHDYLTYLFRKVNTSMLIDYFCLRFRC